jgi:hypothetical protein
MTNAIRGEVQITIGSLALTLAITMDALARLSAATGYPSLQEIYARFHGAEPMSVWLAVEMFTINGAVDGKTLPREEAISQAKARLTLDDFMGMQEPLQNLLASLLRKPDGTQSPGNG